VLQASGSVAPEIGLLAESVERFCLAGHRLGGDELAIDLPELSRCINLLQLKFSDMAATNCHLTAGAAGDRLAVGERLRNVPQSAKAMAGGEIGFSHLALIAREAEASAETGTNNEFDETRLLDKARDYTVGRFRNFCHHQRHAADPGRYASLEVDAVEGRTLGLQAGEGGMLWIRGVLDPEGGNALRTALEPLARRNGQGDRRNRGRRLADALVELAQRGQRSHLQVTTSLETLLQRAGAPAADVEFSLPISGAAMRRLACDCK